MRIAGVKNIVRKVRSELAPATSLGPDNSSTDDSTSVVRPALLEVNKWETSSDVLKLYSIIEKHPYPLDEISLMVAAFRYHRPEIVIDVGTHLGKSARIWFELSQKYSPSTRIHTIDLCDPAHEENPGDSLGKFIKGKTVEQHIGDGFVVTQEILTENPDAVVLVFFDGDHQFETVKRELSLLPLIKRGCVLLHDTFYQPGSTYNHGPYLAIEDALQSHEVKQVIHLQTGLPGMSYIGV